MRLRVGLWFGVGVRRQLLRAHDMHPFCQGVAQTRQHEALPAGFDVGLVCWRCFVDGPWWCRRRRLCRSLATNHCLPHCADHPPTPPAVWLHFALSLHRYRKICHGCLPGPPSLSRNQPCVRIPPRTQSETTASTPPFSRTRFVVIMQRPDSDRLPQGGRWTVKLQQACVLADWNSLLGLFSPPEASSANPWATRCGRQHWQSHYVAAVCNCAQVCVSS